MSILPSSPPFPSTHGELGTLSPTFSRLIAPLETQLPYLPPLVSGSNRPLAFTFEFQARALVYYHTEAFTSAQDLLQAAHDDPWANRLLVPATGLGESTFYEANASRGSQQLLALVDRLSQKVSRQLKVAHLALGALVALDGSLIEASLSMHGAAYSSSQRKAKVHVGFDLNRGLPRQLALTAGNGAERPFVSTFLAPGETGVVDRGYVDYQLFDTWINEGKHFVARIRKNAQWELLEALPLPPNTNLFFFAKVRLGDAAHRMTPPLFLIGFKNRGKVYWIVTDRQDLSAEQLAFIFALRWEIESFFAWWKKHLDVYHLLSRNPHGVLLQLLAGLVTYLLLLLYCQQRYGEPPALRRLRQLRRQIRREATIAYLPVHTTGVDPSLWWLIWVLCCQNQANL